MIYAGVIIRLIYHYHVVLSFVSVVLVSLPVLFAVHSVPDIQSIEEQVTFHALLVDWHYRGTSSIFSIYALSYNQSQHYFDYNRWVGYPEQRSMMVDDFYRNMI